MQTGGGSRAVERGRFAAATGQPRGTGDGFDEAGSGQHFAAEVGPVEGGAPDRLVDLLELAEGELGRAEGGGQARVLELGADAFVGVGQDAVVVEGERPRPVVRHPAGVGRVAAAVRFGRVGQEGGEGDGDDPHPGVAVGLAVGAQLFQMQPGDVRQPGLLGEFTPGGALRGLVRVHEPAGQRPVSGVRLLPPLHEQHVQGAFGNGQDGEVDGDGEGFVGVLVVVHSRSPPLWSA